MPCYIRTMREVDLETLIEKYSDARDVADRDADWLEYQLYNEVVKDLQWLAKK